jgi:hypothetical protein
LWTANEQANPELFRIALKLATGAGKTTVIAMLLAWQTVNAVRRPASKLFTRGFLICTPGITIRDRLRVLLPGDPDNYYKYREIVPNDLLGEIARAKIVITNYHAFKLRERLDVSKVGRALLKGRGPELNTTETEGQMLQRVMPDLAYGLLAAGFLSGSNSYSTAGGCVKITHRRARRERPPKATPKPPQCDIKATPKPPDSQAIGTPKPPQSHPKATPKPP